MKSLLVLLFVVIFFSYCENIEQKNNSKLNTNSKQNNEILVKTFNKRSKNIDNFFFLDYWFGMSKTEYQIISDSLVENNTIYFENNSYCITLKVIETKSYKNYSEKFTIIHEPKFSFYPTFNENELVCLVLVLFGPKSPIDDKIDFSSINHVIALYKEKYGRCITNKPNPTTYISKMISLTPPAYKEGTYYEFIEYIWNMNNYLILNYEGSGLTSSVLSNESYSTSNYFKISYLTNDFYNKILEERNKRKFKKDEQTEKIKKETFDKI